MQKARFFLGPPEQIAKEFEDWQTANPNFKILGLQQAISTIPLPGEPPEIVPVGKEGMISIQIQTIICLMVVYEDLPGNPT